MGRARHRRHHVGTVMTETVIMLPLIAMLLVLILHMDRTIVRVQRTDMIPRYEVWRVEAGAPGPNAQPVVGHPRLNKTFFAGDPADLVEQAHPFDPAWRHAWVSGPRDRMVEAGAKVSPNAETLVSNIHWLEAQEGQSRYSNGWREFFRVRHDQGVAFWDRVNDITDSRDFENPDQNPTIRYHYRIGTDWPYTTRWTAAAPDWRGGGRDRHHLRSLRDAFYLDFDTAWDAIDGVGSSEYENTATENPTNDQLSGLVRRLYLDTPGYSGPEVP